LSASTLLPTRSRIPLLLLHGAWHDSRCWDTVADALRNAGHRVYTPDLPGHGKDSTPLARITLNSYASAVIELLDQINEPVILAGHSMAGMVVAQCSSLRPALIRDAVYLCAYLPRDGESLFDLISLNRSHEPFVAIELAMQMSADKRSCSIADSDIIALFYSRTDPELAELAKSRFAVQATLPLAAKVKLAAESFDQVPRTYISCTQDKVIPLHHQRRMVTRQACRTLLQIDSDHSPFYSAPAELTALLAAIAE